MTEKIAPEHPDARVFQTAPTKRAMSDAERQRKRRAALKAAGRSTKTSGRLEILLGAGVTGPAPGVTAPGVTAPRRQSVETTSPEAQLVDPSFARDIGDEILEQIAAYMWVPKKNRVQFKMSIRLALGLAREMHRRQKLALSVRFFSVASAAEKLIGAIANLNNDQMAWLDEVLGRGLNCDLMIAPCKAPGGWHGAPIRPARHQDLVRMLEALAVAMSGPRVRYAHGRAGAPKGPHVRGEAFQFLIKRFVLDVQRAGGSLDWKRLVQSLELLHPFATQVIPRGVPKRTLERLIAEAKKFRQKPV